MIMRTLQRESGLALTEVLLALLILAVLGTAAVSETIQSKTRANVARLRADLNKVAMALESYRCDYGAYPHIKGYYDARALGQWDRGEISYATNLSTPVAYLSAVDVRDPFSTWGIVRAVNYINVDLFYEMLQKIKTPPHRPSWYLLSNGPDQIHSGGSLWDYDTGIDPDQTCRFLNWHYDPSNGTLSYGDVVRYSSHP